MPNLLTNGAAWLGAQLQAAAGVEVRYVRRADCVTVTAWPTIYEYEVLDEDGVPTRVLSYDWAFVATDLELDGQSIEPRPGDVIVETVDGLNCPFEAMPLGKKPCFERLDASGQLIVVHTKRVS